MSMEVKDKSAKDRRVAQGDATRRGPPHRGPEALRVAGLRRHVPRRGGRRCRGHEGRAVPPLRRQGGAVQRRVRADPAGGLRHGGGRRSTGRTPGRRSWRGAACGSTPTSIPRSSASSCVRRARCSAGRTCARSRTASGLSPSGRAAQGHARRSRRAPTAAPPVVDAPRITGGGVPVHRRRRRSRRGPCRGRRADPVAPGRVPGTAGVARRVTGRAGASRAVGLAALVVVAASCSSDDPDEGSSTPASVRVVSQNLLHGIACPADSDGCDLPGPGRPVPAASSTSRAARSSSACRRRTSARSSLLRTELADVCGGDYEIVWDDDPGSIARSCSRPCRCSDRSALGWPARCAPRCGCGSPPTSAWSTSCRATSPAAATTGPATRRTCPPPCEVGRDDQRLPGPPARGASPARSPATTPSWSSAGDLNAEPGDPAIEPSLDAGFVDTHLLAGNPECDPGDGCAVHERADRRRPHRSDRPGEPQSERIDYLFVGGDRGCPRSTPTGLFNGEPAAAGAGGLVFPADHTGVQATIECATTDAQRDAATCATVPSAPPTTDHRPPRSTPRRRRGHHRGVQDAVRRRRHRRGAEAGRARGRRDPAAVLPRQLRGAGGDRVADPGPDRRGRRSSTRPTPTSRTRCCSTAPRCSTTCPGARRQDRRPVAGDPAHLLRREHPGRDRDPATVPVTVSVGSVRADLRPVGRGGRAVVHQRPHLRP